MSLHRLDEGFDELLLGLGNAVYGKKQFIDMRPSPQCRCQKIKQRFLEANYRINEPQHSVVIQEYIIPILSDVSHEQEIIAE